MADSQPELPPKKPPERIDQKIEVSGGFVDKIVQIGTQVVQGIDKELFRRMGLEMRLGMLLLAVLILLVLGGVGYLVYQAQPKAVNIRKVGCELCVAVAGFSVIGNDDSSDLGIEFAYQLQRKLNDTFRELDPEMSVTPVWGPDEAGSLQGVPEDKIDQAAADLTQAINADVLVYGIIDTTQSTWKVTPRFYISPMYAFTAATEWTGQHLLGSTFDAEGVNETLKKRRMNEITLSRGLLLFNIISGLVDYLSYDYEQALASFQEAEIFGEQWGDDAGLALLYVLTGNAAGKVYERGHEIAMLDLAEQSFSNAKNVDPGYARAYIGLGSAMYQRAQLPSQESGDPADVDLALVDESIRYYQQADALTPEPDLARVHTKVQAWLGQMYFARAFAMFAQQPGSEAQDLTQALEHYELALAYYKANPEPLINVVAMESYASLGMIYRLMGDPQASAENYRQALALSEAHDPDRRPFFEEMYAQVKAEMTAEAGKSRP
jgi:hypothetical protein